MEGGYQQFFPASVSVHCHVYLRRRSLIGRTVDQSTSLKCDQTIMLVTPNSLEGYPEKLRRVKYHDSETNKTLVFLTNNFNLSVVTITELFRYRWHIELFFK